MFNRKPQIFHSDTKKIRHFRCVVSSSNVRCRECNRDYRDTVYTEGALGTLSQRLKVVARRGEERVPRGFEGTAKENRKTRYWYVVAIASAPQDDELVVGAMAMETVALLPLSSFVDESRLRRYNCGLRSETRGNLRERNLFPSTVYWRVRRLPSVRPMNEPSDALV